MKRFYRFETMLLTLAEGIAQFLNDEGIYREIIYNPMRKSYAFRIRATENEAEMINAWLDEHTIWCVGLKAEY